MTERVVQRIRTYTVLGVGAVLALLGSMSVQASGENVVGQVLWSIETDG